MTEWTDAPLGELVRLINGDRGKNYPSAQHRVSSGIPFINAGHLDGGRVRLAGMDYIEPKRYDLLRSGKVEAGDVLLCIRGSIGRLALVTPDAVPGAIASSLVILRPGPKLLPKFLAAFLDSPDGRRVIQASDNGAAQPNIGAKEVARFRLPLPTLSDQVRIVEVLGALDDLIENNRRRAEVLEEMARSIYREWFVHFRYPGHGNATLVDSQLGRIPQDWSVLPASDALTINPRVKLDKALAHPFVTMADIDERSMIAMPSDLRAGSSGAKFVNGDTLFARITPCLENGKTGYVQCLDDGQVGRGSTEFIVLRGANIGPASTYCLARSEGFRRHAIASMSGASGRQRVRNECFDAYMVAVPPTDLSDQFEECVGQLFETAYRLSLQARQLISLRDLLLPNLVTGNIDVSALRLDELVEESVA